MIRMTVLCLGMGILASVLPQGCGGDPDDGTDTERGVILTSASSTPDSAEVEEAVTLSAVAAGDIEGGTISYSWLQTSGPGVAIANANQPTATFAAPSLASNATLGFAVTTTNERGDVGRANTSLVVQADPNYGEDDGGTSGYSAPVARAGPDREVTEGLGVTLDASNSRGDGLTYAWEQTSGTSVDLKDEDTAAATFTAPGYQSSGSNRLVFKLRVEDRRGRTAEDTLTLTVLEGTGTEPKPRVLLRTSMGNITLELNRTKAPISVNNFLTYVKDDFYDGTIFHRVIANFVVQGGGFDPGLEEKETEDPIQNESDNGLSNTRGTVAMARTTEPNSATSQFYVNVADNSGTLDYKSASNPGYAVFGTVVEGMDVVDAIAAVATESRDGWKDVPVTDVILIEATRITE